MDSSDPKNPVTGRRSSRIRSIYNARTVSINRGNLPERRRSDDKQPEPKRRKVQLANSSTSHAGVPTRSATFEAAQRAFLQKHRALFLDLLPNSHHKAFMKQTDSTNLTSVESRPILQPLTVKGEMKSYQLSGLSFLVYLHRNAMPGILADEMGLGKTLQTLSLLSYLKEQATSEQLQLPHLIICPLSVLSAWQAEIKRWTALTVCTIHGSNNERVRITKELGGLGVDGKPSFDIILTTYETYEALQGWFKYTGRSWDYVVLDEGHRIKNWNTQLSHSLQSIRSAHRLILTGTPVQNNLIELWSLLHWLLPQIFVPNTLTGFSSAFNLNKGEYNTSFLNASRRLLNLLMLRRTKDSVQSQLTVPPKQEITLFIPISSCQRFWVKRLLMKCDPSSLQQIFTTQSKNDDDQSIVSNITDTNGTSTPLVAERASDSVIQPSTLIKSQNFIKQIEYAVNPQSQVDTSSYKRLMNLLMQLRKVCNHPYLMPHSEPEPFDIAEHVVEASNKLVFLDKLLTTLLPQGKRVLIFSGFTKMLDILEDFLNLRSIEFLRLDGQTSRPRRSLNIRLFQNSYKGQVSKRVFLLATTAGGLGINLTAADTVVMYDSSWNPQHDIQAIARAHRIGQTRPVTVYRLICAASVEEQMLSRLRKKLYLSLKIMETTGGKQENESAETQDASEKMSMSAAQLCSILRSGTRVLDSNSAENDSHSAHNDDQEAEDIRSGYRAFLDSSFEEIVQKAREDEKRTQENLATDTLQELDDDEEEEIQLLQGIERVRTRLFEGRKYVANRSNKQIGEDWVDLQRNDRIRKSRTCLVDGHAVENNTIGNGRWEAVKTITSDKVALSKLQVPARPKGKFEHEDDCLVCHDGGDVYLCSHCPRVAHAKCLGWSNTKLNQSPMFACSQHSCVICKRSTADAGGLLFRCQTCSAAYCDECLPEEEFHPIGEVLPEFLLLGYGASRTSYFIRCVDCLNHFKNHPGTLKIWEEEESKILEKLTAAGIPYRP